MILVIGLAILLGSALAVVVAWIVMGRRDTSARREAEVEADTLATLDECIDIVRRIGEP